MKYRPTAVIARPKTPAAPVLIAAAGQSRSLQWADAAAVFGLAMTAVGLYFTANHLLASHLKLRNL